MRKESDGTTTAFKQSTKSSPSRWRAHNSERAQSQNAHQSAVLQCKFENSLRRPQKHSRERKNFASLKISAKSPAKIVRAQNPDQRKRDADFRHRGPERWGIRKREGVGERAKRTEGNPTSQNTTSPRSFIERSRDLSPKVWRESSPHHPRTTPRPSLMSFRASSPLGREPRTRKKSASALLSSEKPCIFLTKA